MMNSFIVLVVVLAGHCIATSGAFTATTAQSKNALKQQPGEKAAAADSSSELHDLYNQQISNEFQASQLYLAASIEADRKDLVGMASYFRNESDEERDHALQFIDFALKRNLPIQLQSFAAPPTQLSDSTYDLWETLLQAEQGNTKALQTLADVAMKEHDHAVLAFLQPFHMEQVEAEDQLGTILAKIKDEQQTPGLLRLLDQELLLSSKKGAA